MSPRKTTDNPLGLDPYEGQAVTELGMEIPGAAGGFREPLEVDITLLDMLRNIQGGDTIYAVLQLDKVKVKHVPAKNHDGWKRVDIFDVSGVAIIDKNAAVDVISEQRDRVQLAKEQAQGIQRLGVDDGPVEASA